MVLNKFVNGDSIIWSRTTGRTNVANSRPSSKLLSKMKNTWSRTRLPTPRLLSFGCRARRSRRGKSSEEAYLVENSTSHASTAELWMPCSSPAFTTLLYRTNNSLAKYRNSVSPNLEKNARWSFGSAATAWAASAVSPSPVWAATKARNSSANIARLGLRPAKRSRNCSISSANFFLLKKKLGSRT